MDPLNGKDTGGFGKVHANSHDRCMRIRNIDFKVTVVSQNAKSILEFGVLPIDVIIGN